MDKGKGLPKPFRLVPLGQETEPGLRVDLTEEDLQSVLDSFQALHVGTSSTVTSSQQQVEEASATFVLTPLARDRLGVQPFRYPGTKVLGPKAVKFWTEQRGVRLIRALRAEAPVISAPLSRARGRVDATDLVIPRGAVVLRNEGQCREVVRHSFEGAIQLPTFSLIFTEFLAGGYLFHTTWQWEQSGWLERALSVWDAVTLRFLDAVTPPTIYCEAVAGTHEAWHLYL